MRVSDKMIYTQINDSLHKSRSGLTDALGRASSQKRVNKPSDDPMAATRVLSYKTEDQNNSQYLKILSQAKSNLEFSEQSLGELADVLVRLKELTLGAVNDASTNPDTRRTLAREVKQLYQQVVNVGNRKLAGKFIFGGYTTTKAPFDFQGNYVGDNNEIKVPIDREAFVSVNMPGSRIFLGKTTVETHSEPTDVNPQQPPVEGQQPTPTQESAVSDPNMRGPASVDQSEEQATKDPQFAAPSPRNGPGPHIQGVNIFNLLRKVEIALESSDKLTMQTSLDEIDEGHNQVVTARSEMGSRLMNLNSAMESLLKTKVDTKATISDLEDEDAFKSVSDVNKTEATLKATLATSSKLMQPSLLDFLR